MGLIIRSSDIHAAGCYTTTRIPKGTRVAEGFEYNSLNNTHFLKVDELGALIDDK